MLRSAAVDCDAVMGNSSTVTDWTSLTGHSGRHFNPSIGLARGCSAEARAALGNWQCVKEDKASRLAAGNTATRYASEDTKVAFAASEKHACLVSVRLLLRKVLNVKELKGVPHQELLRAAASLSWQTFTAKCLPKKLVTSYIAATYPLPPGHLYVEKPPHQLQKQSGSSVPTEDNGGSSSDSSTDSRRSEADGTVRWAVVQKGRAHVEAPPLPSDSVAVIARGRGCYLPLKAGVRLLPAGALFDEKICKECYRSAPSKFIKRHAQLRDDKLQLEQDEPEPLSDISDIDVEML